MLSVLVHEPQASFLRRGSHRAFLSPVRLNGPCLLHNKDGQFALVRIIDAEPVCADNIGAAGVTEAEKASNYTKHSWVHTFEPVRVHDAGPGRPSEGPILFMVRQGKHWQDRTEEAGRIKALCRELAWSRGAAGSVARGLRDALKGVAPVERGDADPLRLLNDAAAAWPVDEPLRYQVDELLRELVASRIEHRALPVLKHPDPVALLGLKDPGFLSHVRRASREGAEQLLVNEKKLDRYESYHVYAKVRQGASKAVQALSPDIESRVVPYQREAYAEERDFYFIPLEVVERYEPPIAIPSRWAAGRTFGGAIETAELLKRDAAEIDDVGKAPTRELKALLRRLAKLTVESRGSARERYLNTILFIRTELQRRGEEAPVPEEVEEELAALSTRSIKYNPAEPDKSITARVHPGSGGGGGEPLHLGDLLQHVKPIIIRDAAVSIVGSICNEGVTRNDVDVLVRGPMDEATRRVVEFRLGRMFPPHISNRMSFHGDELGGPFTNHVQLYDLALIPRNPLELKEMRDLAEKADPYLEVPDNERHEAVLQAHYRGSTMHFDLRFRVNDHLIGWTLAGQTKAIPDIDSLDGARRVTGAMDVRDGSRYNKPLAAPNRLWCTPKSPQPLEWLRLKDKAFDPGTVGATPNKPGFIVVMDRPKVQWGAQKPYFHEYFITGADGGWNGILTFRLLEGEGDPSLAEVRDRAPRLNSPSFAYLAAYGKERFVPGRDGAPKKQWRGMDVDEHLPDDVLSELNDMKEIEARASCEGHGPDRPTFFVFRLRSGPDEDAVRVADWINDAPGFRSLADQGAEGKMRVVATGRTWYGQDGWERWWKELPAVIARAVGAVRKGDWADSAFMRHVRDWVKDKGLLDSDGDYEGILGEAVLHMAETFAAEQHSGFSAMMARAAFNAICDEWEGVHTLTLNDEDYKKAKRALAKRLTDAANDLAKATPTPQGRTFWTAMLTKDLVPYVLSRGAVDKGWMPPDGISALPRGLMESTPAEHRYWQRRGAEARKVRDALVASKHFTAGNVRLDGGRFRRVESKAGKAQQVSKGRFRVLYQYFKTRTVTRAGPSRKRWFLVVTTDGGGHLYAAEHSPIDNDKVALVQWKYVRAMMGDDVVGYIEPGKSYGGLVLNDTKEGDSWIIEQDAGEAALLEDGQQFKRLDLKGEILKGTVALKREGPGSDFWIYSKAPGPGQSMKRVTSEDGVQYWFEHEMADEDDKGGDRAKLKPIAFFRPMKPASRCAYTDVGKLKKEFLTPAVLRSGVFVEPKWNGRVFVVEHRAGDDKVVIFSEEAWKDYGPNMPKVVEEVRRQFRGRDVVLVGELMAERKGSGEVVPRRELAAFTGKKPPEDMVPFVQVFDVPYYDGNFTQEWQDDRRATLERIFKAEGFKHLRLTPSKQVKSLEAFADAAEAMMKVPGSEGLMVKQRSATYSLGGENDAWAKYKATAVITAVITERDQVKGSPGVYNFTCAIGPVGDPDKWRETVEVDGKRYATIGKTGNAKVAAKRGDRIRVEVLEYYLYEYADGTRRVHWFGPPVVIEKTDQAPTTLREYESMGPQVIEQGESVKRWIVKDEEERYVFGVILEPLRGDGEHDAQGDTYTADEVSKAFFHWTENHRKHGLMHRELIAQGRVVLGENYLAPIDFSINGARVKKGTWLQGNRIRDDQLWRQIKRGEITGYSIGGYARRRVRAD